VGESWICSNQMYWYHMLLVSSIGPIAQLKTDRSLFLITITTPNIYGGIGLMLFRRGTDFVGWVDGLFLFKVVWLQNYDMMMFPGLLGWDFGAFIFFTLFF